MQPPLIDTVYSKFSRIVTDSKIYKARIKSTIEEQLTIVDDIEKISDDYKG